MKFCTSCGAQMEDTAAFCTSCGASTVNGAPTAQPFTAAYIDRSISFKAYLETYADPAHLKTIKQSAIICYVCLALSLIVVVQIARQLRFH